MSLGIKTLWRARPSSCGIPRSPVIPREGACWPQCPYFVRRASLHSAGRTPSHDDPAAAGGAKSSDEAASLESSDKPSPELSPGKILIESLADQPLRPHSNNHSVLVKPYYKYPTSIETNRSKRKHHQSTMQQARLETRRQVLGRGLPDWRMILMNLTAKRHSTIETHGDTVRLLVPNDAVRGMLDVADSDVKTIVERIGCTWTLKEAENIQGHSWLLLSGTEEVIDRAAKQVMRITKGVVSVRDDADMGNDGRNSISTDAMNNEEVSDEESIPSVTSLASPPMDDSQSSSPQQQQQQQQQQNFFRRYTLTKSAHELEKPDTWTRDSFKAYIAALTNGRLPPHLHSHLYGPERSHQETVMSLLHLAFNNKEAQPAITPSAFNMALEYMTKRGGSGLGPDARALFVRMDMLNLPLGIETFNILLRAASEDKDLHGFEAAMRLMDRRGVAPDRYTWLFFLRMFESEMVRRHILRAMEAKGLLRDALAVRQVAREMVSFDIERWAAAAAAAEAAPSSAPSLADFWAAQEARYGDKWFSNTAGNKMIEVLGRYGRFAACTEVLDRMLADPYAKPDVITFNTMLTHCKLQRSLDRSIAIIRQMEKDCWYVAPDQITYHLLFETAFAVGAVHVLGIVWRYASLAGITSWRMRRRVTKVLDGNLDSPRARLITPELVTDPEALATVMRPAPDNKRLSRTFRGAAASRWYAIRYEDYEPAEPLGVVMQRAYERDRRLAIIWKESKGLKKSMILLEEAAFDIPLRPKQPPRD